jgi:hypothetical protein
MFSSPRRSSKASTQAVLATPTTGRVSSAAERFAGAQPARKTLAPLRAKARANVPPIAPPPLQITAFLPSGDIPALPLPVGLCTLFTSSAVRTRFVYSVPNDEFGLSRAEVRVRAEGR